MKKSTQIYLALTLIGVILIGLGSGITVFEISNYKTADYTAATLDPNLPPLETNTETLEVSLQGNDPFQLNTYGWIYDTNHDVRIDNTLENKVLIEVTQPKDLYNLHLSYEDKNTYTLYGESRDLDMFRLILQTAKEGYLIHNLPDLHITLVMNDAQAQKFTLNKERDRTAAIEENYRDEISSIQENHQDELSNLHERYQNEMDTLRENYENQLEDIRQNYENQLENLRGTQEQQLEEKQNQIEQLQQQLEDIRSSLN